MFSKIKIKWAEARSDALRHEVEDSIAKIQTLDKEVSVNISQYIRCALDSVIKDSGSLTNLSSDGKKIIAKELQLLAKKSFDLNMAKGYGYFLCGSFIEAQALPGNNARAVETIVSGIISLADKLDTDAQENPAVKTKQDKVALEAIAASKYLGANSAREAAEMSMGRSLSDAEWYQHKEPWERNWS